MNPSSVELRTRIACVPGAIDWNISHIPLYIPGLDGHPVLAKCFTSWNALEGK
jgi:hypothetical protein